MMRRYAVLVDVGYVLAGGGQAAVGTGDRNELQVDYPGLLGWLRQQAQARYVDGELLRIYWFDASPNQVPSSEHITVDEQPDTKLRLGRLTFRGQKGVDALLLSDITELARNRAVSDMVLVAGDGDHVVAVEQTQALGVRVELWTVRSDGSPASSDLRRAADRHRELSIEEFGQFFARVPLPPAIRPRARLDNGRSSRRPAVRREQTQVAAQDARDCGQRFAIQWLSMATASQIAMIQSNERPFLPQIVDGHLLRYAQDDLSLPSGSELSQEARVELRVGFWDGFSEHRRPGTQPSTASSGASIAEMPI
jgi:uncharacterized LabA/DUF88 family protein